MERWVRRAENKFKKSQWELGGRAIDCGNDCGLAHKTFKAYKTWHTRLAYKTFK